MRKFFYVSAAVLLILTIYLSTRSPWFLLLLLLVIPYIALGVYDCLQTGNNVYRNFPVMGHVKNLFVHNRELLQDWIFENEREIRPFDRIEREIVYRRADNQQQTVA